MNFKLQALLCTVLAAAACTPRNPGPDAALFTPLQYEATNVQPIPTGTYRNPVLPGFYPDPSICRVGRDYYMVNSTFGYYPGIPVWHSTDLVDWEQIGNALTRNSQMKLPDMNLIGGVFAPQISYNPHNKLFYIINTIIGGIGNFFVTTDDPKSGVWSEPVALPDVKGIDPSLLFDEDGTAWVVSAANASEVGETPLYEADGYIPLLQFDWENGRTVGESIYIAKHGVHPEDHPASLEGPHLYHIGDKYYLMCAEGGTETGHSEVLFIADNVRGPYEPAPINPILTQRDLPKDRLDAVECTGHADLVQTEGGDWYAVFLGTQAYDGDYWFNTGRQTFMLPVSWADGQPVILPQGEAVRTTVPLSDELLTLTGENTVKGFYGLYPGPLWDGKTGIKDFVQFIRKPVAGTLENQTSPDEDFDFLKSRKSGPFWDIDGRGNLTLRLKPVNIRSLGNPSAVTERITAKTFKASTKMTFTPSFIEGKDATEAGLICFQNNMQLMKFVKTLDAEGKPVLLLQQIRRGQVEKSFTEPLESDKPLMLKVEAVTPTDYVFSYSFGGKNFKAVGEPLDGRVLSTMEGGGFQGAMVGIYGTCDKQSEFVPHKFFGWSIDKATIFD